MEYPTSKVLFCRPRKVKWYSKLIRVPLIILHGKYSLIAKIEKRDRRIFYEEWAKFANYHFNNMRKKYGDNINLAALQNVKL